MKKLLLFVMLALVAGSAFAATGWYSDYIINSVNGGADEYYWIGTDPSWGTQFAGSVFNITLGQTFEFGADMRYWSDTQDRQGGAFYWQIDTGTATEQIWTQAALGGNDFQGTLPSTTVDVASGLGVGSYAINVWAKSWGSGQGDDWLNNASANYTATLNVNPVPEPATMSLLGLGALVMALRRKMSK